jgi:hypothetical protein
MLEIVWFLDLSYNEPLSITRNTAITKIKFIKSNFIYINDVSKTDIR